MVAVGSCAAQCIGAGPARSAASRRACARRAAEQRTQASAVARDGYVDGCGSCTRARKQQPRFTLCMIDIEAMDSSIVLEEPAEEGNLYFPRVPRSLLGTSLRLQQADRPRGQRPGRLHAQQPLDPRSCDFTAHMCTGMILSNYMLFVNPLFKLISIEHVIIGSKTQWKTM